MCVPRGIYDSVRHHDASCFALDLTPMDHVYPDFTLHRSWREEESDTVQALALEALATHACHARKNGAQRGTERIEMLQYVDSNRWRGRIVYLVLCLYAANFYARS